MNLSSKIANMKKILLTIGLPSIIIAAAVLAIGSNCGGGAVTPTIPCNTSNSPFMVLYNAYGGGSGSAYTYDKQTFEYTFTSSANGKICAIGYQGHPNLTSLAAYKMEIIDATTSVVLHTGTYAFPSAAISYQTIPLVTITAGQSYILRETVVNNLGVTGNTKTHFKQIPFPFAPIVNGSLTITGTRTYDQYMASAPYNIDINGILPRIDFVFN